MDLSPHTRVVARIQHDIDASIDVLEVETISGGACQDNLRVRWSVAGGAPEQVVLRSDAPSALPGSISRREEAAVLQVAAAAGVPVPRVRWVGHDIVRDGATACVLDWVDGETLGRRVVSSAALAPARRRLPAQVVAALAAIHAVPPQPSLPLRGLHEDPVQLALQEVRDMEAAVPVRRPALALALRWLSENMPPTTAKTLVHRDFRTGNLMVSPERGLVAVLDWEFARYGDPMEDLGWFCVRDWRFGQIHLGAGGLFSRAQLLHSWNEATGHNVSMDVLTWWEVLGNVRWAASALLQGQRARAGGKNGQGADVELLAIPRRAAEMEWEALRRIRSLGAFAAPSADAIPGPVGDSTPPAELLNAVTDVLRGPVLETLSSQAPDLAWQVRVAVFLLGGISREIDTPQTTDIALYQQVIHTPLREMQVLHDRCCHRLAYELSVVQPTFSRAEDAAE